MRHNQPEGLDNTHSKHKMTTTVGRRKAAKTGEDASPAGGTKTTEAVRT